MSRDGRTSRVLTQSLGKETTPAPTAIADYTLGPHAKHLIFGYRHNKIWTSRLLIRNDFPNEVLQFRLKVNTPENFRITPIQGKIMPGSPPVVVYIEYLIDTPTPPPEKMQLFSVILSRETPGGQIIKKEEQRMCSLFVETDEFLDLIGWNEDEDEDDDDGMDDYNGDQNAMANAEYNKAQNSTFVLVASAMLGLLLIFGAGGMGSAAKSIAALCYPY